MAKYSISSISGEDYGTFEGRTPHEALVELHHDAGYTDVKLGDGGHFIIFPDAATKALCGDVKHWHITKVSP